MPAPRCLSLVVMLDANTAVNGALMVIPGSHHEFVGCPGETPKTGNWEVSLRNQTLGVPSQESIAAAAAKSTGSKAGLELMTGPPGTVFVFDCNLLHASASNPSPSGRRNVFIAFNSIHNKLGEPYSGEGRPEHLAARDPATTRPVEVDRNSVSSKSEKDASQV